MFSLSVLALALSAVTFTVGSHHGLGPPYDPNSLRHRFPPASPPGSVSRRLETDNIVSIGGPSNFCIILPRTPRTNIGDSEHPGGMKTYCSPAERRTPQQGGVPAQFWRDVDYKTGTGRNGKRYAQLTGCIRPELASLNPGDSGGQYDSSGGRGGRGNPEGSKCTGFNHYVELVEPGLNRACIRCCEDAVDCPVTKDTQGCLNVIPGNYFDCR